MTAAPRTRAPQHPIGRIPVLDVRPCVDAGARPAKSVVDEEFDVTATVFREGHDAVNASVVLTDPGGAEHVQPMTCTNPGLNTWVARVAADSTGWWTYRVEGWSDPYGTWEHDATIKVQADVDTELMLEEGALVLERARDEVPRTAAQKAVLADAILGLRDTTRPPAVRLKAGTDPSVEDELAARPLRDMVTPSTDLPLLVERELALCGAWYEIFPRSEGATYDEKEHRWTTGTLRTAAERLPAIAAMGFDVVYLTPVHPIGQAAKKGPNNTLDSRPEDPGSPYAIGSPDGGHDAIHPDLGTFEDFDAFVAESRRLGMEVAMDLALQCSPDHPWVKTHPEWFTTRADGTIAYAENPPKKYQDIYPLNFDNDPAGIYAEVRRVVQVWIDHGVTLFRVDNPHTKPVEFWQWLIADVAKDHPEVIWLAEAFTKPAMMHTLGQGRLPAELHLLHLAQQRRRPARVRHRALRRGRRLHAAVVLADDARHPHALHAVRRPGRVEAAGGARGHARADLRHLRRLRADGARGPARRRGADRQREVPVQGPPVGRLRAGWHQGRGLPVRLAHDDQRRAPGPPGAAPAARHPLPPRRRRELPRVLEAAPAARRHPGRRGRRRQPRPALHPRQHPAARHGRPGPRAGRHLRGARRGHRRALDLAARQLRAGWGPRSSRCTWSR